MRRPLGRQVHPGREPAQRYRRIGADGLYGDFAKGAFAAAVRRYLPEIEKSHLVPVPAGVRAQALRPDGSLVDDFVFVGSARVLRVKNAPSPAATSALAISSLIAERALATFESP